VIILSYSFEFVRKITADSDRSDWCDRDWDKAYEMDSKIKFQKDNLSLSRISENENGGTDVCQVNIEVNPDGDFEYCVSESVLSDGTLAHLDGVLNKLYNRIITGISYCKSQELPDKYNSISYTVGNYIILTEHGDKFRTEDKPFLKERISVMLPVRCVFK
jgi:hypothetical protein